MGFASVGAKRRGRFNCSVTLLVLGVDVQGLFLLAHGFSFQGDLVGIVNESAKNGVGERGVCDGFVPVVEGQLGGDEGGASLVSVFQE